MVKNVALAILTVVVLVGVVLVATGRLQWAREVEGDYVGERMTLLGRVACRRTVPIS